MGYVGDMGGKDESGRLIMRGAQATAGGFVVRLAARLVFLFVAGRLFGAAAFGAFALAVAAVELAVAVGGVGTKKTLFQLLDRHGGDPSRPLPHVLLDAALLVTLASLLLGAAIAAVAVAMPESLLGPAVATALVLLAPMVAGQALLDLFLAATRWTHAVRHDVVARSVIEPWAMLAGASGAWLLGWRAEGLALGYGCGTLGALAYAAVAARRRLGGLRMAAWRPDPRVLAETARGSAVNTVTDLLNALYTRVDLYLVGILLGEAAAGIYGMGRQLVAPLRQIRQSFDGLLIPLAARTLHVLGAQGAGKALSTATRLVLALLLPLLLVLLIAGRPLLEWIGPGFAAGYWAMLALATAETIQAALSVGDLVFVYLRPRLALWLTLGSIAAGIVAALLLIPPFGLAGAGLSVLVAYVVRAIGRSWLLRSQLGMTVPWAHNGGPVAAAVLGAVVGIVAGAGGSWGLALIAALSTYVATILAWMKASRQRLALAGFAAEANVTPS